MPKVGMEPIRKQQVIEATMSCIHEDGVAKASLGAIANRAGITSGLILHYFGDKEGLFEVVYRELYKRLAAETLRRLKLANSANERLLAVLESQVCNQMVEPKIVATWFALGAKATESPVLAQMEKVNSRRLKSNIVHELRAIGYPKDTANEIAGELRALIYGLWVNLAHKSVSSPAQARLILDGYLKARIPQIQ